MIFASNNKGKLKEIREIFAEYEILSLQDCDVSVEVVEDGKTFYDNALKKAKEIYEVVGKPVIADDSGLMIDCFEGWPGVMTARFLGDQATSLERNMFILEKMQGSVWRNAKVVCELVYYDGKSTVSATGIIEGKISLASRGTEGFGFDPIFELRSGKTLAELSSEEKNKISARYLAAVSLKEKLENLE